MGRLRILSLLCGLLVVMGVGEAQAQSRGSGPRLVMDLSQPKVEIAYSFSGADVQLYGAIEKGRGKLPEVLDVAVVLRGPSAPRVVRKKDRVAGVWLNTRAVRLETAPGYYAVASTRPISELLDEQTAAIYELGVEYLHFSPTDTGRSNDELRDFQTGFVDLSTRRSLFAETSGNVRVVDNVLFGASIHLPANVPVGTYRAEVFLLSEGRVLARQSVSLDVDKIGFERWIYSYAHQNSLIYGCLAVFIALSLGWVASAILRR